MAEQRVKFAQKLTEIVRSMPRLGELLTHTRALGARHVGYGVRALDYQTVGDSLIAAIAAVLGDEFDAATREAWVLAFNIVAETMLEGAPEARPIGSYPAAAARRWPGRGRGWVSVVSSRRDRLLQFGDPQGLVVGAFEV